MAIALVPIVFLLLVLGLGLGLVIWLAISRKWAAAIAVFAGGGAFLLILLLVVTGFYATSVTVHRAETDLRRTQAEELRRIGEAMHAQEASPLEAPPAPAAPMPIAHEDTHAAFPSSATPDLPIENIPAEAADPPPANDDAPAPQADATGPLEPYSRNLRQITQGVTTLLTSAAQSDDPERALRRVIPEGRPKWVEREPYWEGKVQFRAVSSGPFESPIDCQVALEEQIRREVDDYIGEHLDYLPANNYVHLDQDFIRDHIQIGEYQEELDISFGEMRQLHAHLQFNDHTRTEIDRQWSLAQRTNRLIYLGAGFAAVLSALSIFYVGLGGQPSSKQGPTGRLRAAVILAILLVGSGAVVLVNLIPLI